jgi:manganese oxidase
MSTPHRPSRFGSPEALIAFGLPIFLAVVLVPILFLVLPRTSSAPTPAPAATVAPQQQQVHLTVNEWRFEPKQLQLPLGRPVTLVLDNDGHLEHDVTIPALGVQLKAAAGKSATQTVTASKAGTFDFVCSLPGHKEAGMQGQVTVADGQASLPGMAGSGMTSMPEMDMASSHPSHAAVEATASQGNQPLVYTLDGDVRVFDVKAEHVRWEVLPGEFVDAYGYNGMVPGPLIRATEGDKVRINFTNELPEPTVIHFHGPKLPNSMDGVVDVTQKMIAPGETFTYEFVARPGGTFMYHTHHNSAEQEAKGLYGVFIVDPKQVAVQYDKEYIQVLSELGGYFLINGKAFPATEAIQAKVGERVLIRLVNLGQMSHPMHMHGHAFNIVGTDGYPVPESQALTKDVVNIGPGERYDLLMTADNPGTWLFHCHILTHVQNHGVEPGGMITVVKVEE